MIIYGSTFAWIDGCDWRWSVLLRKMIAPIAATSKQTEQAEGGLFLRLEELARSRPFLLDCSVQQAGEAFVTVLSDYDSGAELCAWSGPADAIVVEFEAWLDKRFPQPVGLSGP
jgi:hypothetical protein